MSSRNRAENVQNSAAFKKSKSRANEYLNNPDKLLRFAENAFDKAKRHRKGALKEVWDYLMTFLRLLKSYANGSYREMHWDSMIMIVTTVAYFLMPMDLIPDFIVGFGFLDDAALLSWTMSSLKSDIDKFVEWERLNANGVRFESPVRQQHRPQLPLI
jgi:uncharacterized membrane protein YkvA (DUF1232 family)